MLRYETLFLAVPEITSDEASALEKQFDKTIMMPKDPLFPMSVGVNIALPIL